jgi:hypothetical protein
MAKYGLQDTASLEIISTVNWDGSSSYTLPPNLQLYSGSFDLENGTPFPPPDPLNDPITGSFTGSYSGSFYGTASLSGSFTGSFYGLVFGSGSFTGSLTGSLTGSVSGSDKMSFSTSANQTVLAGEMAWNDGDGTLDLGLKGGNVTLQLGQEQVSRVYNAEATTLNDGEIVYISGSQGNRISVKRAGNSAEAGSRNTIGMVTEPILAGEEGFVTTNGVVNGLNTIGLTAGATLYLGTNGGYTETKPVAPDHTVVVGFVQRVHASVGSIFVKIDNGYEIGELHDIIDTSTTSSYGDLLVKSGSVWTNSKQLTGPYGITGSLLITGSKTIIGQSYLTGSLFITGSESIVGYLGLEPVAGLTIPTNKSASYIYTSGSTNDLYFTQYQGEYTNTTRLRWIESNLSTGLLHGGVLSSTTGSTEFTVTGGEGIIVTQNAFTGSAPYPTIKLVSWPTQTLPITYSGSAKITYVGVNNVGTIVQQDVPWGSTDINQYDTEIEFGVILHLSGSVSNGVFNAPQIGYGHPQQSDDFMRAFGPLKLSGHTLQASGSTLSIVKSGGRAYVAGANYLINPNHPSTVVENSVNVSKIYRSYTSGSTQIFDTGTSTSGYTVIDPTQRVDTATGLLTSVATNKYSLQRVFWVPNSPRQAFIVYYGNAQYDSLIDALNAKDTEPFVESAYTATNAIFLGWIAIAGGASSLTNPADATIAPAGIFRSIGGIGSTGTTPLSTTLASLSDVSVGSRTAGDLLYYNGSQWESTKQLNASYGVTGSIQATSFTGSLQGTASNAISSSYAVTSSFASSSPAVYDFGSFATPTDVGGGGNFGIVTDGDKGDITVSSIGSIWTIDNDAVTYAKIQTTSTGSILLGRGSASGSGDVQEITLGDGLTMTGTTLAASGGGGLGAPTYVVTKTADETITDSTTLQQDDHLFQELTNNKSYYFELRLLVTRTNTTANVALKIGMDGNSDGYIAGILADNAQGTNVATISVNANVPRDVVQRGAFKMTSTYTVRFIWAQNAAVATTGLTVMKGSQLKIWEVA